MSTYIDIAKRIAEVILSPDSVIGFTYGVLSASQVQLLIR